MTREQAVFWLKGFLANKVTLSDDDIKLINSEVSSLLLVDIPPIDLDYTPFTGRPSWIHNTTYTSETLVEG